ncbi:MAG: hypothetical protein VX607_08335, partial [Planctomycetota bacterium]|nr:hypothetical protein [Planctomycetota bacterium]
PSRPTSTDLDLRRRCSSNSFPLTSLVSESRNHIFEDFVRLSRVRVAGGRLGKKDLVLKVL